MNPRFRVLLTYRSSRWAACICSVLGLALNLLSLPTAKAKSGRVHNIRYIILPNMLRYKVGCAAASGSGLLTKTAPGSIGVETLWLSRKPNPSSIVTIY